eukprot:CFRG8628T1
MRGKWILGVCVVSIILLVLKSEYRPCFKLVELCEELPVIYPPYPNSYLDFNVNQHWTDLVETIMKQPVIVATVNAGYTGMTLNWYLSVKRLNLNYIIVLVSHDMETLEKMQNHIESPDILAYRFVNMSVSHDSSYQSDDYNRLVSSRASVLLEFTLRDIPVIYTDTDTVWQKDPFPYVNERKRAGDDIATIVDVGDHCTGFIAVFPSERTLAFLQEWVNYHKENTTLNQPAFNSLARKFKKNKRIRIGRLSKTLFPSGKTYFEGWGNTTIHAEDRKSAVIVHNNFIIGYKKKVQRFKDNNGLWLLDTTEI